MKTYGKHFSELYNSRWRNFSINLTPKIVDFLKKIASNKERTILDLCCGTGQSLKIFCENDFSGYGLDLSAEMLEFAKANNSKSIENGNLNLICGDATNFVLPKKVNFVTSLYDALNHLSNLDSLKSCFKSVYENLDNDGIFIFDLNTKSGLAKFDTAQVYETGDYFLHQKGIYSEGMDRAYFKLVGFHKQKDNSYQRFEETITNLATDQNKIKKWLLEVGFTKVYPTTQDDFSIELSDPESLDRVFWVCYK